MNRATCLLLLLVSAAGPARAQSYLGLHAPGGNLFFHFFQGEYQPGGNELFLLDDTGAHARSIRTANIPPGTFGPTFVDLGVFAPDQVFGFEWFFYGTNYGDREPEIIEGDLSTGSVFLRSEAGGTIYYSVSTSATRPLFQVPASVPEPVSMVLLGTGLLGVSVVRRRRRTGTNRQDSYPQH
jgi:hypothetical protein